MYIEEIKQAIKALGFRSPSTVGIKSVSLDRYLVRVNDENIGIYDTNKHTFVD